MSRPLLTTDAFIDAMFRLLDDAADEPDRAAIDRAIIESEPHRVLYREIMLTESALAWGRRTNAERGTGNAEVTTPPTTSVRTASADRPHNTAPPQPIPIYRKGCEPNSKIENRKSKIAFALAAAFLAACGLAAYFLVFSELPHSELPDPTSSAPLATLIESTPGSTLTTPGGFISEGRDYPRGEYALSGGQGDTAEFMLTNAVNVQLRGNTRMVMHNPSSVSLATGQARFVVPQNATGFTVNLPRNIRVVDRGTAFAAFVDRDGHAAVYVIEGVVDVESDGASRTLTSGDGWTTGHATPSDTHVAHTLWRLKRSVWLDDPNLLAWWSFDDDTADDASPRAHHGVTTDTASFSSDVPPAVAGGRSLATDGTGGAIVVEHDTLAGLLAEPGDELTLAFWMRADAPGTFARVIDNRDHSIGLMRRAASNELSVRLRHQRPGEVAVFANGVYDGNWHHVAVTVRLGDTLRVYIDGELIDEAACSDDPVNTESRWFLGGRFNAARMGLAGRLDEIALFDRRLDAQQIHELAGRSDTPSAVDPHPSHATPGDNK